MHIDGAMFFSTGAISRFQKCMGLGYELVWRMRTAEKLKDVCQKPIFLGVGGEYFSRILTYGVVPILGA